MYAAEIQELRNRWVPQTLEQRLVRDLARIHELTKEN